MRHKVFGNQLARPHNQAKALYRSLVAEVLDHGRIQTTLPKAKAVVGLVDRVINLAKKNDSGSRRQIVKILGNAHLLDKLFQEVAPNLADRSSGYSRIIRIGERFSDTTKTAYLELVNFAASPTEVAPIVETKKQPEKIKTEKFPKNPKTLK